MNAFAGILHNLPSFMLSFSALLYLLASLFSGKIVPVLTKKTAHFIDFILFFLIACPAQTCLIDADFCELSQRCHWHVWVLVQTLGGNRWDLPRPHNKRWKESEERSLLARFGGGSDRKWAGKQVSGFSHNLHNVRLCKKTKRKYFNDYESFRLGISFTVTHKSLWQPKRTSSKHSSAINPSKALRAKFANWFPSSMKSSSSPGTWKGLERTQMFSSLSTESTATRAGVTSGRSSATSSNEGKRTGSSWRCSTLESCWGSRSSTMGATGTAGGF